MNIEEIKAEIAEQNRDFSRLYEPFPDWRVTRTRKLIGWNTWEETFTSRLYKNGKIIETRVETRIVGSHF